MPKAVQIRNKYPTGYAQAIMRMRVDGKGYKEIVPILEKEFAADIKALGEKGQKLNLTAEGLSWTMKSHTRAIEESDPELIKTYRKMYSDRGKGSKHPEGYHQLALELLARDVPEAEWEARITERFPELKNKPTSWKPNNVRVAATKVPKAGNNELWAQRDIVAKKRYEDPEFWRALREGNAAYHEHTNTIRVKRRIEGEDASKGAVNEHWHEEHCKQIDVKRMSEGGAAKKYKLNSELSVESRKHQAEMQTGRRLRRKEQLQADVQASVTENVTDKVSEQTASENEGELDPDEV